MSAEPSTPSSSAPATPAWPSATCSAEPVATTSSLDRGRVAEAWRRALGLAAPADAALDDPAPRLALRRPGQEGFMPAGELVGHLERYAASSGAPLELGREVLEVAPARRRLPRRRRRRGLAGPARRRRDRPDRAARTSRPRPTACRRTCTCSPPRSTATPTGCRTAASWSSAPRRPASRSPTSWPGPGVGSSSRSAATPGCRAATAAWTCTGGSTDRSAGPHHRHRRRPRRPRGASRRSSWPGREPGDPRGVDVDLNTLQAVGVEVTGRLQASDGHRVRVRRRPRGHRPAGRRPAGPVPRPRGRPRRGDPPRPPRSSPRSDPAPVRVRRTRARLDLRAEGIGTVAARHRLRAAPPVAEGAGHRTGRTPSGRYRGATPAPGLYVVGQRFQHRRDSATIDGARHDAQRRGVPPAAATTARPLRALELR